MFGLWFLQLIPLQLQTGACAFTVGGACFHCSVRIVFYVVARSLKLNQSMQSAGRRNTSRPGMKDCTLTLLRRIGS